MPKGIPARGYRIRRKDKTGSATTAAAMTAIRVSYEPEAKHETDEEIEKRIGDRFEILEVLTEACIAGNSRALIVSGAAGLGKSYTVESALTKWDPNEINHIIVKGYVRATGLVKLLYQFREAGQVIVFDDADAIFFDDISLNLLKAVCDTTERRRVSWLSEGKLVDEETANLIPRSFDFNGTIIFISNYDFDAMIERGHKLAPHLQAMVSRSHYIDLSLKTRRDYLVRIRQVIKQGLLGDLTPTARNEVMVFIESHSDKLRELSLRMAIKLGTLRKQGGDWERIARVTCCR
jgi:hypothetical protein